MTNRFQRAAYRRPLEAELVPGAVQSLEFAEPPLATSGDAARYDHREGNNDYGQPRFYPPAGREGVFYRAGSCGHRLTGRDGSEFPGGFCILKRK